MARSTLGYAWRLPVKDAPVVAAMRDLSGQYPRYGYRRIHIFLGRQGLNMSPDRVYRIWESGRAPSAAKAPQKARGGLAAETAACDRGK